MIFRLCNLCLKFGTTSIISTQKYATKKFVTPRKKGLQRAIQKLKDEHKNAKKEVRTPLITTKRAEFNFYVGDKFNKFQPIMITQGWFHPKSKMDYFMIHPPKNKFLNTIETRPFEDFNISEKVLENLQEHGWTKPTAIQMEAFPKLMSGENTIIAAETGTGKTLAYLLPLVEQVYHQKSKQSTNYNSPLGLIITPSRELAAQIVRETKKVAKGLDIRTKLIIGGRTKKQMRTSSVVQVDILVATLGALSKFVSNRIYKLDCLKHVVLDEADSLFHRTFHEKLLPFLNKIEFASTDKPEDEKPKEKGAQLTLVSATMPTNVAQTLHAVINTDTMVTATTENLHHITVPQRFIRIGQTQKPMYLLKLIKTPHLNKESYIIFVNKSETCNWLGDFLDKFNVKNICLHGNMPMKIRLTKFQTFDTGIVKVLIATDAGSRGLDTTQVKKVINYDFPLETAEYIHRCGRTGRVGSPKHCGVINFITRPLEIILAKKIELATKKGLPIPIVNMFNREGDEEFDSLLDEIPNDYDPNAFEEVEEPEIYNDENYDDGDQEENQSYPY